MACKYFYTIPGQTKGQWYEEAQLEEVYNQMVSKFDSGSVMGAVELSEPTESVQKQLVFKALSPLIQSKASIFNQIAPNQVDATMKVIDALQKTPRKVYPSNSIQGFYNDLIKQGAPKNQIDLLKQHIQEKGIKEINTNDLITSLLAEMSYTIEINTIGNMEGDLRNSTFAAGTGLFTEEELNSPPHFAPTQHYSNLTVPGGTNYTENEIATPAIIPSIKGHAKFSTSNGIGWFRSDESQQYQETDIQSIIDNLQKSGQLEINCK